MENILFYLNKIAIFLFLNNIKLEEIFFTKIDNLYKNNLIKKYFKQI